MIDYMVIISGISFACWVYLALFHGNFWKPLLDDKEAPAPILWPSIDIIIPARNEADVLPQSLPSILSQEYPGPWRVILIDDHSTDGTSAIALKVAEKIDRDNKLLIIRAPELKDGWSGKLSALNAGASRSIGEYLLFTDADILHPKDGLRRLVTKAVADKLDLHSLMVKLCCKSRAEKFLIPAFVHFFALIYPFRLVRDRRSRVAAAAGGIMLIKQKALSNIGGLESIKSALIDDCTLAAAVKKCGGENKSRGKILLTLTNDFFSLRPYDHLADIWHMIARTAFTQLRYSALLLLGTVLGLGFLFLAPIFAVSLCMPLITELGFATLIIIFYTYMPMVRFYGLSSWWAFTLPAAVIVYLGATIDSAIKYWQGNGGNWKDRAQAVK